MRCQHGARRTHALPACRWSYRQIQDTDLYVDEQFMILCTYFYEYRQRQSQILKNVHIFHEIQANTGLDHEKVHIYLNIQANTAYWLVCGCTIHEAVHIFLWIQANTGTDYEKVHIFLTIQAHTGKYELPEKCIYACICIYVTCNTRHTGTYELLIEFNIYSYKHI